MFTNRVPMGSDTPSPEPLVYFSFIQSFIRVCLPESPKSSPPTHIWGKHTVTVHGAPWRRKAQIKWSAVWFLKGIVTTLLSLPQCHAAFGTLPSNLAWVDRSPVSQQHVSWQPPSGCALHICHHLPSDPGQSRVRIYDTPRYGRGVGFMGGTAWFLLTIKKRPMKQAVEFSVDIVAASHVTE